MEITDNCLDCYWFIKSTGKCFKGMNPQHAYVARWCKFYELQGTAPNTEGRTSTPETTDKPDHEAQ